ncbi:biopolymer transport protein ExbD [Janthinobacterium sp. CG_23.3]|uniref:ExbD/TolR family protein n=1 Tax=unclassified Janthinobacterium TaxID=2610881 RepID=UPI00034DE00D|nr:MULTISPECIES: biopolymer transporter ExbD [unclassified Janthinobacterium]MEC5162413.1 biopolymer transport protein ExbD [Janthinobacterium sp. CG_S6]
MSFGSFNHHRQQPLMADINVTPMVDVMLVLLVIFIISAPMFTHAVKLELPRAQAAAAPRNPGATVTLAIDAAGTVFWDNDALTPAELGARLARAAALPAQPELQLRADKATRYEAVAQVMAAAQSNGLSKLSFVTDPNKEKK